MVMKSGFAGVFGLALIGCASLVAPEAVQSAAALRSGDYALDRNHAALVFRIDHLGFSDFIGRFETLNATLDFDETAPEAARIEAIVDISSLDIANDEFAATLLGPSWFDAARYPQAVFRSTRIERTGERTGRLIGDLTLRGVTLPVELEVVFNGGDRDLLRGGYVVGFSAKGRISRSAFGVDRYDGVISDDVGVEIQAEFLRK